MKKKEQEAKKEKRDCIKTVLRHDVYLDKKC